MNNHKLNEHDFNTFGEPKVSEQPSIADLSLKIRQRIQQLEQQRFEALASYDMPSHALAAHHGLTGALQALQWVLTLLPAEPPGAREDGDAVSNG